MKPTLGYWQSQGNVVTLVDGAMEFWQSKWLLLRLEVAKAMIVAMGDDGRSGGTYDVANGGGNDAGNREAGPLPWLDEGVGLM